MKNKKLLFIVLTLIMICSISNSFADSGEYIDISPKIFNADIVINGFAFDNSKCQNPILNYNGILYLPLTNPVIDALGYELSLNDEEKFELSINKNCSLYDSKKHKYSEIVLAGAVDGKIYNKEVIVNGKIKNTEDSLQKIILYNDVIYLPLNSENVEVDLRLDIGWNDEKKFVINRKPDSQVKGIIDFEIKKENKEEIARIKKELDGMIDKIIENDKKKEFSGQTEYYYDFDDLEYTYVEWDTGDRMVLKTPKSEISEAVYYFGEEDGYYVGHYKDGQFYGLGMYSYEDERRGEIKIFGNEEDQEENYAEKVNAFNHSVPVLVVFTEFEDVRFSRDISEFKDKIFGDGENDLRGYYKDISFGKINFIPMMESYEDINDGVAKVKLNHDHPDYGEDNSLNYKILQDSLEVLDDDIDFSIYDRNDNGVIESDELVLINIVAGYESSRELPVFAKSIWAHKGEINDGRTIFDDVMVSPYCQIGELVYENKKSELSNMTVLAHEIGHLFGLPDLYDTDQSSKGLGPFSLMGEGTNNTIVGRPIGSIIPEFDPWSKIKLGIVKPQLIEETGEYSVFSKSTGKYNVLKVETENPEEYFLIENKILDGRDFTIANYTEKKGGILIYHIDESIINEKHLKNEVNLDENLKGVDLEEADENSLGYSVLDKEDYDEYMNPFFTFREFRNFDESTNPNTDLNDGTPTGIKVRILSDGPEAIVKIIK